MISNKNKSIKSVGLQVRAYWSVCNNHLSDIALQFVINEPILFYGDYFLWGISPPSRMGQE